MKFGSFKINGNRTTLQEISVSTKVLKDIVPFQQEFLIQECDVKMIQVAIRSRSRTKNPTPTPSVVRNPTPSKNLRLRLRNRDLVADAAEHNRCVSTRWND